MRKLLTLFFAFAYALCLGQQTDASLVTQSNVIRDETAAGGNTKTRIAAMYKSLIDSKMNRAEALVATGTDTYAVTVNSTFTYTSIKPQLIIIFTNGNTGAATLTITPSGGSPLSAKAIKKNVSTALSSGDITAGQVFLLVYDGTNWQLMGGAGGGGGSLPALGTAYQELRVNAGASALEYFTPTANPMTTLGDLIIGGTVVSGLATPTRLASSTSGYVLTANGAGAAPSWQAASGLTGLTANRILIANSSTSAVTDANLLFTPGGRSLTVGSGASGTDQILWGSSSMRFDANNSSGEFKWFCSASYFPTIYSNNALSVTFNSSNGADFEGKVTSQLPRNRQTGDYTLVLADNFKMVEANSGSPIVITVPTNASVAYTADKTQIFLARYGAGTMTITPAGGVTIRSADGALTLRSQYSTAVLIKIGTNEWYLTGDLQ